MCRVWEKQTGGDAGFRIELLNTQTARAAVLKLQSNDQLVA
jgi:hypothetical protein